MRKWWLRLAGIAALALVALFTVQAFVCDVYRVDSGSMEPVLHGPEGDAPGESVLVLYDTERPQRFDLIVLRRPGEDAPIVKRVVGLPGESVLISGGDLLIDGKRLPPTAPRPEPLLVFDESVMPMERAFPELAKAAQHDGDEWRIDAPAGATLEFGYAPRITDGYWNAANQWVEGGSLVNDLGVRVDVRLLTPDATLAIELTEEGERYRAEVSRAESDRTFDVSLSSKEHGQEFWHTSGRGRYVDTAGWHAFAFDACDNALSTRIDRFDALVHDVGPSQPLVGAPDPTLKHRLPRVKLLITGTALFRHLDIVRDRFWVARGAFAGDAPALLGPNEIFVLGDDSEQSFDSRDYGPVKLSESLGRPSAVVGPWSRMRWLAHPRAWMQAR